MFDGIEIEARDNQMDQDIMTTAQLRAEGGLWRRKQEGWRLGTDSEVLVIFISLEYTNPGKKIR